MKDFEEIWKLEQGTYRERKCKRFLEREALNIVSEKVEMESEGDLFIGSGVNRGLESPTTVLTQG